MTHLKEAMKTGLDKWKEELEKDNYVVRQNWLEHQRCFGQLVARY